MMGINSHHNLINQPAYFVLIASMFTMQNIAKRGASLTFQVSEGCGHGSFLGPRPRPPHPSHTAYASASAENSTAKHCIENDIISLILRQVLFASQWKVIENSKC